MVINTNCLSYPSSYPANRARNLLAVIDYMAHKDRPDQIDEQGNTKWVEIRKKEKKVFFSFLFFLFLFVHFFLDGQGNPKWVE